MSASSTFRGHPGRNAVLPGRHYSFNRLYQHRLNIFKAAYLRRPPGRIPSEQGENPHSFRLCSFLFGEQK
jgi:hypothetical protein